MSHFPVTNSNLSAAHLAPFLQQRYALGNDASCQLIKAGINDTYLVSGPQYKMVFRVYSYNWRTRTEINEEIKLLLELKENGLSISYPIADAEGHFIQVLPAPEGDRFAVLFSYAPGQKLHSFSTEAHYRIGELMARLHRATQHQQLQRVTYTPAVLLVDSLQQVARFLSAGSEEMDFMVAAQQQLLRLFQQADTAHIRQGIVHMDVWFDNLNITEQNEVTLFDFDFCGNGWLCLDIAYYILQLHNVEKYVAADYQPKMDSFVQGYASITPISDEERRLLPMLGVSMYFFYLGIQCQRFDNWSNSFLSENYLKRFVNGLVKRYYDMYELGNL